MKSKSRLFISSACIALLVTIFACNAPQSTSTPDLGLIVAQTQTAIAVAQFLTSTAGPQALPPVETAAQPPTLPPTLAPPNPTITSLPPSPTLTQVPNCVDKAKFISETIPDDTPFAPGASFFKTWTLQNTGSCTWMPNYALVLSSGDAMNGPSPSPLGQTVAPNATVVVQLPQTAPQQTGEYQGYWKLRNASGQDFGNLWVKIRVVSGTNTGNNLNLGTPTWIETFDSGNGGFYLGADSDVKYDVKNGNLVITALTAAGDQWRISGKGYVDNFYIETKFKAGDACSGEDSYGMILRAPDQPDSIIDTGYVIAFSCAGKYRAYLMNNGAFSGILNWTPNSAIKSGPDQANTMGILAKGGKFKLYANGALLNEFDDLSISTGYFGLVIRSKNTANFQIFVNEISFWDQ